VKPAQRPIVVSPRITLASDLMDRARVADELGVDQIWLEQLPDQRDATIVAAAFLQTARSAMVGAAILPIYTRHPVTTVQAALTLADLYGGRFLLGLGFSHHYVNEYVLGYRQGPPIAAMREYLRIVKGLLAGGSVTSEGQHFTARARYAATRRPTPLYLAALRPQMIRLAVEHCDGILLWLCTPRFVREQVAPVVEKACARFGKDPAEFQVMALLPAYAADDPRKAFEQVAQQFKAYRLIPYYRHVLEAYGPIDPEELCLFGSKDRIQSRMATFRDAGCTPAISPFGDSLEEFADTIAAAYEP
jgi:5,10-methylenetetrahydromethanopterin reductase